ncbi:hypothetical protein LL965_21275 [Xanthomonas cassavae CFBP 4642]|uniref:Uncharacterized protein n=1 Tax=Xanthomonas cassavae CFBP 4642 TaxID=1219375 RepID=A0ABS8HKJ4_9XANT|nr:hypothetical protein [Xanthomonas cassavae]MCC4622465.1 hypothetical protein [Xanthomonas cassavae CFBP 4642]
MTPRLDGLHGQVQWIAMLIASRQSNRNQRLLEAELGITCPQTGEDLVNAAKLSCPNVDAAINTWFKLRYEPQA